MQLEHRYVVFKISELGNSIKGEEILRLSDEYAQQRLLKGKPPLEGLFIEKNWPEYLPTLNLLEQRVDGKTIPKLTRKHNHYFKDVSYLTEVDVYRVCQMFGIEDSSGAIQHAVKKLLLPGQRGAGKDRRKDIQEAVDTLTRKLEMMDEDAESEVST